MYILSEALLLLSHFHIPNLIFLIFQFIILLIQFSSVVIVQESFILCIR